MQISKFQLKPTVHFTGGHILRRAVEEAGARCWVTGSGIRLKGHMGAQLTLIFCLQHKHVLNYNCGHIKNIGVTHTQTIDTGRERQTDREKDSVASMYNVALIMLTTVTHSFDSVIISIHKDVMDAVGNDHYASLCIVNVSRISAKNIPEF